jgi:dipeptidyl aminopeptidase/acylaminoacyl peptidase
VISHADGGGKTLRDGLLMKANLRKGTSVQLAEGRHLNLRVSSSGRFLAALQESESMQPFPDKPIGEITAPFRRLVIFDLKTGINKLVASDFDVSDGSMEWSPSGDVLAYFAGKRGVAEHRKGLYSYTVESGQIQEWPLTGLDLEETRFVWFKERLAIVVRAHNKKPRSSSPTSALGSNVDWFLIDPTGGGQNLTAEFDTVSSLPLSVTPKNICLLANGNVWRFAADGKKTNLTPGLTLDHAGYPADSHAGYSQSTILIESGKKIRKYVLVDLAEDARLLTVLAPSPRAKLMAGSVSGGVALFNEKTYENTRLLLLRANGETREIGRLNQYLADIAKPEWKMISYRVKEGRKLQSGMLLPYNYTSQKRYPVVVDIYPGRAPSPRLGIASYLSFDAHELLAAKGYIVFYVANPPDHNRNKNGPLAGMAEVVISGIEALIAQGYADPNRIGLMGFSQGGFASLWLATQTDRFRSIVSINGWADMASHYVEGGVRRTFYFDNSPFHGTSSYYDSVNGSAVGVARTPWQNPEIYFQNSPVFLADRISTPILLIHSDMDMFAVNQYEEMFTALFRLRKEARFVRYWGEGHGPSSPANIRDLWQRVFAWFDQYLDISRDMKGNLLWKGPEVRSRHGSPPLDPKDFARFDEMILNNRK